MSLGKLELRLEQLIDTDLKPRTSKRVDCPNCGGKNTLSLTNLGTVVLFYCFRATCNVKGKKVVDISIDSIRDAFLNTPPKKSIMSLDNFLFIPEILGKDRIKEYLHKVNCWEAYRDGRADIRYDPHEDRIVFIIYETNNPVPVSACGRKLSGEGPKWKRYGKGVTPFICQLNQETKSDTLIIVEDCCSACAASAYADTAALLGTFLQANYLKEFLHYDNFIIALDKDASKLAFSMQRELHFYRKTKIVLLEEDLKYFNEVEIRRMFNGK